MMIMLYNLFNQQRVPETNISYTDFLAMVEEERIDQVVIQGQELFVTDTNRNRFNKYDILCTCVSLTIHKCDVCYNYFDLDSQRKDRFCFPCRLSLTFNAHWLQRVLWGCMVFQHVININHYTVMTDLVIRYFSICQI